MDNQKLEKILTAVAIEFGSASKKHGSFHSAHEGYAVILEELDELKEQVWEKRARRNPAKMRQEAVQTAAMAVRFIYDLL